MAVVAYIAVFRGTSDYCMTTDSSKGSVYGGRWTANNSGVFRRDLGNNPAEASVMFGSRTNIS